MFFRYLPQIMPYYLRYRVIQLLHSESGGYALAPQWVNGFGLSMVTRFAVSGKTLAPAERGSLAPIVWLQNGAPPSRDRGGKSFQTRKRFSAAAHKPRALDGCAPFRRFTE